MISPGDVVYFKSCAREHGRRAKYIAFKGGTGFAVMLGIVPVNGSPPIEANLMMLMGSAGYMAFDDVANFLGDELGKKCVKMFEEKYYPKAPVDAITKKIVEAKEGMNGTEPSKIIVPRPKPTLIIPGKN
jgi:hypothetical protein